MLSEGSHSKEMEHENKDHTLSKDNLNLKPDNFTLPFKPDISEFVADVGSRLNEIVALESHKDMETFSPDSGKSRPDSASGQKDKVSRPSSGATDTKEKEDRESRPVSAKSQASDKSTSRPLSASLNMDHDSSSRPISAKNVEKSQSDSTNIPTTTLGNRPISATIAKYLEQHNEEDFFGRSDKLILEPIEDQEDISFDKNDNDSRPLSAKSTENALNVKQTPSRPSSGGDLKVKAKDSNTHSVDSIDTEKTSRPPSSSSTKDTESKAQPQSRPVSGNDLKEKDGPDLLQLKV